MKKETDVARDALKASIMPAFYMRVENIVQDGTPDTYMVIDEVMAWVEVKYCRKCPALMTTPIFKSGTHPLLSSQENWLYDHWRRGGRGFIFARIEDFYVLVPGHLAFEFNSYAICQFDAFRVELASLRSEIAHQALVSNPKRR